MPATTKQSWDEQPPARILIVDDWPANLTALRAVLEPLGHDVVQASSGAEALRQLLGQDFAIILMDVQMPELDGVETAKLIKQRERSRHIPILFLTAINAESTSIFKGYATGAVDYLLKPFDPEILRSKVSVFVDLYQRGEMIKQQAALLRKREREALARESELRFQGLTDSMPQCVWAAHRDGRVAYANKAWVAYVGEAQVQPAQLSASEGEASEVPFLTALHPDDREHAATAWREALAFGKPFEVAGRLCRHDGEHRWHLARGVPQRDEGGAITGWVVTATDIDDQKRAEAREHEAREEAERANRMKDEFLATVSHELRTPLNAIIGWTYLIRSGKLEAPRVEHALETVARNANLQLQLIQDILDVSRIIAGKLRVELDTVDPITLVHAAIDAVRPAAEAKGITLAASVDPCDPMPGDPARLQQVVWNLLSNAVKFTPKGGHIEVRVEVTGERLTIIVHDTGEGIPPEFLPRVFDRFSQEDSSMTRKHGGLGLGLSIVRHLVALHGGVVRAESAGKGQGSTFFVELPRTILEPEASPTFAASFAAGGASLAAEAPAAEHDVIPDG